MKRSGLLCLILLSASLGFSATLQAAGGGMSVFCPLPSYCNLSSFGVSGDGFSFHGTERYLRSYGIDFGAPGLYGSQLRISAGGQISSLAGDFFGFSDGVHFTENGTGSFGFTSAFFGPEIYSIWGDNVSFTLPGYGCVSADADLGLGEHMGVATCGTGVVSAQYTKFTGIPYYGATSLGFTFNPIPEPGTLILLSSSIVLVGLKKWRKRS